MHWNVVEMMMGERVRHWQKEADRACVVREARETQRRTNLKGHDVPASCEVNPADRARGEPVERGCPVRTGPQVRTGAHEEMMVQDRISGETAP